MAVKKEDFIYEIKANVSQFNSAIRGAGNNLKNVTKAIDRSQVLIDNLFKGKVGAKEYRDLFKPAEQSANKMIDAMKALKAETSKGAGADKALMAQLEQTFKAARLGYAAKTLKAGRQAQELYNVKTNPPVEKPPAENIVAARYALYDMANEARRVGVGMTAVGVAAAKLSIDFQRAFIDVARTTDVTGGALGELQKQLVDISKTTPIAFGDIAKLATLASQMGIEGKNVSAFSENVAKFSAVTGVSVETASSSFGRIAQLLKVSSGEYENLSSSILYAGRNSVATEEEILALTTQIGASAAQAGMAADETVGLATALASLRIPPEQARGVILRLFADFDKAIAENGKALNDYATVLGITSTSAASLWKNDPSQFFTSFVKSLSQASAAGKDVNVILQQLGITETRETNVLQRLSGNYDLLVKSMDDAQSAYADNTDLSSQYAQITSTVAEKLKTLVNALEALGAAAGMFSGILPLMGLFLDAVTGIINIISSSPPLSFLAGISALVVTGTGLMLLFKAGIAQAIASVLAMRESVAALGIKGGLAAINMKFLISQIELLTGKSFTAKVAADSLTAAIARTTIGTRALGFAARALPFVGWGITIASLIPIAMEFTSTIEEQSKALAKQEKALKEASELPQFKQSMNSNIEQVRGLTGEMKNGIAMTSEYQRSLLAVKAGKSDVMMFGGAEQTAQYNTALTYLTNLRAQLEAMLEAGNEAQAKSIFAEMSVQAKEAGISMEQFDTIFGSLKEKMGTLPPTADELKNVGDAALALSDDVAAVSDEIKNRMTSSFITANKEALSLSSATREFASALAESAGSTSAFSEKGSRALSAFNSLIEVIIERAGNDMPTAIQGAAAAISLIEQSGGDASVQMAGLVERINSMFGLKLNPATITSIAQLQARIAATSGIAEVTKNQISALLGGGDFTNYFAAMFKKIKSVIGSGGTAAKKEIKSIFDYMSSISSILSNVTKLAFGFSEATDNAASGWSDTQDRINKAKDSIKSLNEELSGMKVDKQTLEYQLSVATRYGDTKRIAELTAKINKLNGDIAEKQNDIADAQKESSTSLKGMSKESIRNRADIRSRVDDAKALIEAYASTAKANGQLPTDAEIKAYAKTVSEGFVRQGVEIGYAASELTDYANLIAGFGKAAAAVTPPNVKVNLDPVTTAITAYLAKEKSTKVSTTPSTASFDEWLAQPKKTNLNVEMKPYNIPTLTENLIKLADQFPAESYMNRLYMDLARQTNKWRFESSLVLKASKPDYQQYEKMASAFPRNHDMWKYFMDIAARIKALQLASGGYVQGPGTTTSDSIPAMLSRGEYVVNAASVGKYGVNFMNALNEQRVGMAGYGSSMSAVGVGGASSSVVYLSPDDRALLRAAIDRPINLYTDNAKIAQSANAGNVVLAQRGTN